MRINAPKAQRLSSELNANTLRAVAIMGIALFSQTATMASAQTTPVATPSLPTPPAGALGQTRPETAASARRILSLQQSRNYVEARNLATQTCDRGEALACFYAGLSYQNNQGGPKNDAQARRFFVRGCESGMGDACLYAGYEFMNPEGGTVDAAAARRLLSRGCDFGNATSCAQLASLHFQGAGGPKDFGAAMRLAGPACSNNVPEACYIQGGIAYYGSAGSVDYGLARTAFDRGCTLNHGKSCEMTAILHGAGQGGPTNSALARTFFDKSCGLENNSACTNLAGMFVRGDGGSVDLVKARELFTLACTRSRTESRTDGCKDQLTMMVNGQGGPSNPVGAYVLSVQLCVNGLPADICGYRGAMLYHGVGTVRDQARGLELMRAACSANDVQSCNIVTNVTASPARK